MAVAFTLLLTFALLVANEAWWRSRKPHDELSRKFIHITVGSFVAFWPFFLSWNEIRALSVAFLIVVAVSRYFKLLRSIHAVQRPTWGEVCFALAAGSVTFVAHDKWVYAAALLQMSLADGLAAVGGMRYGKGNDYKVFGHTKSLAGTGTFLVVSYLLLLSYSVFINPIGIPVCLGLAIGATALENVAVLGIDNLAVPLFVASMLQLIA